MGSTDRLPPDQRAVLELVLRRGRSYDEIARTLSIDRADVRQRALAALDALGPKTRVPAERRALITDYLLGALPERVAEDVQEHLRESASERAWARAVASELREVSEQPLPEIPAETSTRARMGEVEAEPAEPAAAPEPAVAAATASPPTVSAAATASPPTASKSAAAGDPGRGSRGPGRPRRSSRVGGAILLAAGAAVVIAVVLVLVLSGGGGKHKATAARARTASTPKTSTSASTGAKIVAQINLKPPAGGASPVGIAEVLQAQGQTGIAIAAQGLTANSKHPPNWYAVWLYNSPTDSHILGFVNPAVSANGQLKTAGGLPSNASHYQKLLVTLETTSNPPSPGRIVLEGNLTGL